MKEEKMNVEALSRAELLTLLSVLEGELEAQDVVIHTLRAEHRDSFVQERYGHYNLSDPFLALQRDSEAEERQSSSTQHRGHNAQQRNRNTGPNPLTLIKMVMTNCKRMQERMLGQLAAVESRHRKVISELEEDKLRRLLDCAQSKDFAAMLQTERDALLQQLESERTAVRRLETEQSQFISRMEELQQERLSSLSLELQKASSQAEEEAQNASRLRATLQEETAALEALQNVLETERSRADQLEAKSEQQQADFDVEREQMKARLIKEEDRSRELEKQLEELRKRLALAEEGKDVEKDSKATLVSTSVQTVLVGKDTPALNTSSLSKVNGHHGQKETAPTKEVKEAENGGTSDVDGGEASLHSPLHLIPQSPSSPASCSLSSSPVSSPVLTKRPGFHQPSYQAGVNQRFQAARHKFQSQAELDQQQGCPLSPRDLSPTTTLVSPPPEHSTAKQLARNTVTQVLSRFTSQQAGVKMTHISSSPFGTDYRNLAASPSGGRSPSSAPQSPGFRSLVTASSEKTYPPPIPPKRLGMSPTPGSPSHSPRTSLFPELTGNSNSVSQEAGKEPDAVLSSSS